MKIRFILLSMFGMLLMSCSNKQAKTETIPTTNTRADGQPVEVQVQTLRPQTFSHDIVSNGKVAARNQTDLYFSMSGEPIAAVYVRNGSRVKSGQAIASLSSYTVQNKVKQALSSMEQAKLELKDVLIGQGYDPDHMDKVPARVLRLAEVKSGYAQSKLNYEQAKHDVQDVVLRAPYDGVIANLTAKAYSMPSSSEPVCRLIGTSSMTVTFQVLENELQIVKQGVKVEVTPFSRPDTHVQGTVEDINPMVDDNGLVKVTAKLSGNSPLFEGMNVRVRIQQRLANQYVVPKTAVVLRSGRHVVFSEENGKAMWHYVSVGLENLDSYTITGDDLRPDMRIIIQGGQNLAHETPVKVKKQKEKTGGR